jgi:hypothetical protein
MVAGTKADAERLREEAAVRIPGHFVHPFQLISYTDS